MWIAKIVFRSLLRRLFRSWSDASLCFALVVLALLLLVMRASAAQYEFNGVYKAVDVFTAYCEDCFLELPPEFLQSEIVLAVKTDKEQTFRRALQKSAAAVGWNLSVNGRYFVANPVQNSENLVYLSCMTNEPVNVPKYLYWWAIRSDSLKCAKRDSLYVLEQSNAHKLDSLSAIRLPFNTYELKYFSFTRNFTDKLGLDFDAIIADGDLRGKFKLYDNWRAFATRTNDTAFTFRSVLVSFDSSLSLDWGTEEQTLKTAYVTDNGVVTNEYEWRKYGLIVQLSKDTARVRLSYIFRDKEQNISVLQGSAVGGLSDTLRVYGQYNTRRVVNTGFPLLSSIPVLKYLFSTEQVLTDTKHFELYLIPKMEIGENRR